MYSKNSTPVFSNYSALLRYTFIIVVAFATSCKYMSGNTSQLKLNAAYHTIDSNYQKNGGYRKSDVLFLDSVFNLVRPTDNFNKAKRYNYIMHYAGLTNVDSALIYADSSISLLQNQTLDNESAILLQANYFVKGDLYFRFKNYDEAIRNYTLGKLSLSAGIKDPCKLYAYYHSMANVLYAQQKYLQAPRFFRLKYTETTPYASANDPFLVFLEVQENMDNAGMCYYKAGFTDSAMYYYNATLEYINENEKKFKAAPPGNFDFEKAVVYFNQGKYFISKKKWIRPKNFI